MKDMNKPEDDWRLDMYIQLQGRKSMKEIDEQYSQYYKDIGEIMRKSREKQQRDVDTLFVLLGVSAAVLMFITIVGVIF